MADTIVNTPGTRDDGSSALGWTIGLLVLLAVVVVGFLWLRNGTPNVPNTGTDINVTVPAAGGTGGGGAGGGAGY